jgi:glutamate--cysteine ligase catalytic subunit
MGYLAFGTPLSWTESLPYIEHIKEHGLIQFVNLYNRLKERSNDSSMRHHVIGLIYV